MTESSSASLESGRTQTTTATPTDLQAWLERECAVLGRVERALLIHREPDGEWQPEAMLPLEAATAEAAAPLLALADKAVAERCPLADPHDGLLAFPLHLPNDEHWVFCCRHGERDERRLTAMLGRLQLSIHEVGTLRLRARLQALQQGSERLLAAHRLLAVVVEQGDYAAATQALVNELATVLNADRVSLGRVEADRVAVVAISGTADFRRHQDQVEQLRLAMQEAYEQGRTLVTPADDADAAGALRREQEALIEQVGGIQVLTLPLQVAGRTSEVVCIERPRDPPLQAAEITFAEAACALVAPVLRDKARGSRALPAIVREHAWQQLQRLLGRGYPGRKLLLLGLLALVAVLVLVLVRLPFRVSADARLEGAVQRSLVAPFDGYMEAAPLRAGDRVRKGQVIARLDDADLQLEALRWQSRLAQLERQIQAARARGERNELGRLEAERDEAKAELALARTRLERTRLRAPFDAVIVEGDLSQRLGGAVKQGEPLFLLAPLDRYRVVLQVPESELALVHPGQQGELVFDAFPERRMSLTVERITSESSTEDGVNRFRVEAVLDGDMGNLQPGLEGVPRIEAEELPLWQALARRPLRWLRLWLWRWLP